MRKNDYNSSDIQILSDRDHVRLRTPIYLGNMNRVECSIPLFVNDTFCLSQVEFVPAVYKAVGEILDNSNDELVKIKSKKNLLIISAETEKGQFTITDNGRGIPIDIHDCGKYTPEVALGSLRAGRNFGKTEAGVIGRNGVGSACTNYCSSSFNVTINRDCKVYNQSFKNGALDVSKPIIKKGPKRTGTSINFTLDQTVFTEGVDLPESMIHNRAIELAFNNPGLTVEYQKKKYKFNNGFDDIVKNISKDYYKFETEQMQFYIIFDKYEGIDEKMFTWVNSTLLFDGGLCNSQFINAFYNKVCQSLTVKAKKQKCVVTKNDVKQDLLIIACLKLDNPEYDGQSKTRLTGPDLRKPMIDMIDLKWKSFNRANKIWLETVLERAEQRHKSSGDKLAIKQLTQKRRKKVPGLMDATSKYRHQCILTVTEGLSASSMISEVRDPQKLATFPLTGKINNVHGCSPGEVLKMTKIINLLLAIGLVPGQKAIRKDLNYGQIWISTDADPDGNDICSLLVNLFYRFWPELFDPNRPAFIKRLVAPNVVVYKGTKRIHFPTSALFEKQKNKYKNWSIDYYKGLGSMLEEDWNIILYDSQYLIDIVDTDNKLKQTLNLLFNDKLANERKVWLQ